MISSDKEIYCPQLCDDIPVANALAMKSNQHHQTTSKTVSDILTVRGRKWVAWCDHGILPPYYY